ncbi:TauD/TfdA family dioxygenase [Erwinia amylovora]|uniref:TauD/TfdA family dioxygenase n=1 Tax=Erwinia amylovora TaxID=552 RepID=UPI0030DA5C6F
MNKDEEEMLLVSLMKTLRDPRVYYAHQWQTGDFILSDNLSLLHGREQYTHLFRCIVCAFASAQCRPHHL